MTEQTKKLVKSLLFKSINGRKLKLKLKLDSFCIRNFVDVVSSEYPVDSFISLLEDAKNGETISLISYYADFLAKLTKDVYCIEIFKEELKDFIWENVTIDTSEFDIIINSLNNKRRAA